MNDDLEMDERHEIDDLFRDTLGNYQEPPSDGLWRKLNRRLNRREAINFITFKRIHGANGSENPVLPLYRQQWFRIAVAACIALLIMFTSVFVANRTGDQFNNNDKGIANNKAIKSVSHKSPAGFKNYYHSDNKNLIITEKPDDNQGSDNFFADRSNPDNKIEKIPNRVSEPDMLVPQYYDGGFSNNMKQTIPDKRRSTNNKTGNDNNITDQINIANNDQPKSFTPNNNGWNNNPGPVIADNGNNNNLFTPNIRSGQHTGGPDTDRIRAARIADSLIKATLMKDSVGANEINPNKDGELETVIEPVLKDQVTDKDKEIVDMEVIVPNVFTPNGDGLNDYLYIANLEYYPDNSLIIQDRKGKIIFRKKEYQGNWDAANVPDGTYFYILTYKNSKNQNVSMQGVVYIIR
jgi:gliding motility-associated-like protein